MLLFLVKAGIAVPAFSQSGSVITAIRVTGLRQTKAYVAEEPLRRFIGQEAAVIDTDQVKAAVIDQGILEPVSVTVEDDAGGTGKTLVVEVREKWTIFPVPVFFAGSGEISAGLFFFNANAFGLNHKMAAGGMYRSEGWLATALYIAPPGGPRHFGWIASVFFSEGEQRNSDANDTTLRRFNTRSVTAGISPQYQISNALSAAFHVSYTNIMIPDTENPVREPDSGAQFIQLGPEFSIRKTGWDGYLLSEESASVKYNLIQDIASPSWHSFSFRGVYEKSLVPGFRVSVRGGGLSRPGAPPLLESGPGDAEVAILPGSFSARHYAGLSLGLEKYLYRFSLGTVSLLGAWQMTYSNGPLLGNRFDYGVMGSLRFYMSRLAIPAVGMGVAYNVPADYFQFSFSIGMTL
ncbi:MAG: hypothetical protein LBJ90_02885 [Treponema sp.]|nr:hypothetical protein [Treponema sp.]